MIILVIPNLLLREVQERLLVALVAHISKNDSNLPILSREAHQEKQKEQYPKSKIQVRKRLNLIIGEMKFSVEKMKFIKSDKKN